MVIKKVLGRSVGTEKQDLLAFIREALECFEVMSGPDYAYLTEILPEEILADIRKTKIVFNLAEDNLTTMSKGEVDVYVSSY